MKKISPYVTTLGLGFMTGFTKGLVRGYCFDDAPFIGRYELRPHEFDGQVADVPQSLETLTNGLGGSTLALSVFLGGKATMQRMEAGEPIKESSQQFDVIAAPTL